MGHLPVTTQPTNLARYQLDATFSGGDRNSLGRNEACSNGDMTIKKQLKRHLGKAATKRIYASAPWIGGVAALAAGVMLQRRGVRGVIDDVRNAASGGGADSPAQDPYDRDFVGSR